MKTRSSMREVSNKERWELLLGLVWFKIRFDEVRKKELKTHSWKSEWENGAKVIRAREIHHWDSNVNFSVLPLVNPGFYCCRRTGGTSKHQQEWIHLGNMQISIPEKNNPDHKNSVHKGTLHTAALGVLGKQHIRQKSVMQYSRGK